MNCVGEMRVNGRARLLRSLAVGRWLGRSLALPVLLFAAMISARADDVITNIMSSIVSYQYPDDFSSEVLTNGGVLSPLVSYQYLEDFSSAALTNGGILSPIVSYQYFEWPGNDVLGLLSSPSVSYYYQFLDAPILTIIQTNRTPKASEITPRYLPPPPTSAQLEVFTDGAFTTNVALNPNIMTIVLTHGWIMTNNDAPVSPNAGVGDWPTVMAQLLTNAITNANIVAWNWRDAAISSWLDPKQAGSQTPQQGTNLGAALLTALGPNYSKRIHFIGHSFGTLVNAYAANFLHGDHWAAEPVSLTPWPATNMLMTLFDEAEVGADKNFKLVSQDIQVILALAGFNDNYLNPPLPYYHPLPKQFVWADNYVSAFGLLHRNAANVILTNGFPTDAPNLPSWLNELVVFHNYPFQWYEETIQTSNSPMGFTWSFLWSVGDPTFANAPSTGSVYIQTFKSSPWDLTVTNWNFGTNFVDQDLKSIEMDFGIRVLNSMTTSSMQTAQ